MPLKQQIQMNPEKGGGVNVVTSFPDSSISQPGERVVKDDTGRSYIFNHITGSWNDIASSDTQVAVLNEHWENIGGMVYRLSVKKQGGVLNHGLDVISKCLLFRHEGGDKYSPQFIFHTIDFTTMEIVFEGCGDLPFTGYVQISND